MHKSDRRQFLAASASTLAAPTIIANTSLGADGKAPASDRITIGVIGLGSRGYNLIDSFARQSDVQIVGICDVDRHHYRDRPWGTGTAFGLLPAKQKIESAYQKKSGKKLEGLATYSDFRELTARSDIDAIVVATPDHWHALCTLTALRNSKDVYCEKPVTHLFREGQLVAREVARQQAVFQTGSQQRSDAKFRRAVELVRNGVLGKIKRVEVGLPPGYDKPQGSSQNQKIPKQLDYDSWCGPSVVLPYMRARHHRWWRGHRAYGGGVLMDWIGHHNDIAHWALDLDSTGPTTVQARQWVLPETDIYDSPQDYTIRCTYPGGVESTISSRNKTGLRMMGENGWVFVARGTLTASDDRWLKSDFNPGEIKVRKSDDHTRNFLDCVKSRMECIAPAQTAHRSITPGHLAYVSAELDRKLNWDADKEVVVDDEQANQVLNQVSYRDPWIIDS